MNVMRNKWILRREISRFNGLVINNMFISESGIIAAAHLSGPGNVKNFYVVTVIVIWILRMLMVLKFQIISRHLKTIIFQKLKL